MASGGSKNFTIVTMEIKRQHRLLYAVRLSVSSRAAYKTYHLTDRISFILQSVPKFAFPKRCRHVLMEVKVTEYNSMCWALVSLRSSRIYKPSLNGCALIPRPKRYGLYSSKTTSGSGNGDLKNTIVKSMA